MIRRILPRSSIANRLFSTSASAKAGRLYICGTGESNKLGLGDTSDRETPTVVEALADIPITHVSCGRYHTAALSADGDVYTWGLADSGQLGLGSSRTKAPTPQKVDALSGLGVKSLSCGMYAARTSLRFSRLRALQLLSHTPPLSSRLASQVPHARAHGGGRHL